MENKLKTKMLKGETTLGTFHELGSASAIECLGYAGLDYVIIDSEHGPFSAESIQSYVRAAKIGEITPLVRVNGERNSILKMLDAGAMGLIIPNIHTVDEVKEVIKGSKYYPIGERGVAPTSGNSFWYADYTTRGLDHFFKVSNRETLIIPQCETLGCLENIEEIVNLVGVDGIFIGPYDLSTALGKPGQFEDQEVKKAIQKVLDACKSANKFSFIYAGSVADIREKFDLGFHSVAYGMDAIVLAEAFKDVVNNVNSKEQESK
nr:aldolase/citrate lyase family protein [Lysinibacillus timonensis]